eukprot:TRINITY_DN1502_c0_g1_i4.p1 TRINITY_DN1502_c0_g1~~TRINITY_DN1502_c0_g1_i4.p1  ORF type:complete len:360 (+),score=121.16 TRINITY_DN1502_c0_g1_i4:76-1155(+)
MASAAPETTVKCVEAYMVALFHKVVNSAAFEDEVGEDMFQVSPAILASEPFDELQTVAEADSDSELELRRHDFNFFWQQQDEAEEKEKMRYMESELSLRQAAMSLFWQLQDEAEQDEKFSFLAPELAARQAAFDIFWQQLEEEEQESKFAHMAAELASRQAAFEFFWRQWDQEELDSFYQRAEACLEVELSIRQSALDAFWQEMDAARQAQEAMARTFVMVGSPAKSLRRMAKEANFKMDMDESWSSKLALYLKLPGGESAARQGSQKSTQAMSRSSSTSAMAIDLKIKEPQAMSQLSKPSMTSRSSSVGALRPVKSQDLGRKTNLMRQTPAKPGSSLGWTVPDLDARPLFPAGALPRA